MSEYQRQDNTGTLFNNDYKAKDSQPDMRGEFLIGNVKYEGSAWKKTSSNGNEYYSFKFQTEEEASKYKKKKEDNHVQEQANRSNQSDSEDLPF